MAAKQFDKVNVKLLQFNKMLFIKMFFMRPYFASKIHAGPCASRKLAT